MDELANWIEEKIKASAHAGELQKPAPNIAGAGERILAAVGPDPQRVVYTASRHGGKTIRVGFAARDRWANEDIEDAVESNGGTMTEFLEDAMEADDELVYPVQHFHDTGWFHFACDIPKDSDYFATAEGREVVWYYFDGYCRGILPIVRKSKSN